ncbi:MAG: DUF5131 family protein [Anaerolineales bacterium]|jgi:protein gp37
MSEKSKIEWTDATWNPWMGCKKVSPGCKNCFMYRDQKRYGRNPGLIVRSKTKFRDPLKWNEPKLIFTCSWSDFFIEEADQWRSDAWEIICNTPQHVYQILTKRPERVKQNLPGDWWDWPKYENVWLGVSVENQRYAERIDVLRQAVETRRKIFVSYEPALGPLSLATEMWNGEVDWLIAGGESGPGWRPGNSARETQLQWFREIRDQCAEYDVPFFFKQHGGVRRIDGHWGGRELDGREHNEMPQEMRRLLL